MVRISDARMSGTAFGTIVLHVTPEAAAGGPLALVHSGDRIRLSVKERAAGSAGRAPPSSRGGRRATPPAPARGYRRLYLEHVLQADAGCDFDFWWGASTRRAWPEAPKSRAAQVASGQVEEQRLGLLLADDRQDGLLADAAPSPAASGWPFTVSAPRATWTQAWRPGASEWATCLAGRRASWRRRARPGGSSASRRAPSGEATRRSRPRLSASANAFCS